MDPYMAAAIEEAGKSRCNRAHVGAVIVNHETGQIVSRAFNETVEGNEPCDTGGHKMVDGHCRNTVHAELGAITQLIKGGREDKGEYTLYTTHYPCVGCALAVLFCPSIVEVVYLDDYNNSPMSAGYLEKLQKGVHRAEPEVGA